MIEENDPNEMFTAHTLDKDGKAIKPAFQVRASDDETIGKWLVENIETSHRLAMIDSEDCCVFEAVDKKLVFPIPENGSPNNVWNSELKQFVTLAD